MNATAADLASGKGHKDENFPVASKLVAPQFRAPVMAFYRFARLADDIADHETASADEKLERLEAMRLGITGDSNAEPSAVALRQAMAERGSLVATERILRWYGRLAAQIVNLTNSGVPRRHTLR